MDYPVDGETLKRPRLNNYIRNLTRLVYETPITKDLIFLPTLQSIMSKRLTQLDFSSILPSPVIAATNRTPREASGGSAISTPRLSPILEADNGGVSPSDLPIYVHEPLNDRYPEAYTVHMGSNKVKVVSVKRNDARGDRDGGFLREFRGSGAIDDVKAVQRISNSKFLEVMETWRTNESFYVVFKFMPLCLVDVSAASSLSENEIPVIFNQVNRRPCSVSSSC